MNETQALYQDKEYIKDTLAVLRDQIEELDKISVYNNDIFADEVNGLNLRFADIQIKMEQWLGIEARKPEEAIRATELKLCVVCQKEPCICDETYDNNQDMEGVL